MTNRVIGVFGVALALLALWSAPARAGFWLWFDSVDHPVTCPADQCVSGYQLELWPQGAVGTGSPVWSAIRDRSEVEPTGESPAYRLRVDYVPWRTVATGQPYVWTVRALGAFYRNPSSRSAPSPETLVIQPLAPATGVEVR